MIPIKLPTYYSSILSCFEISILGSETLKMCLDVLENLWLKFYNIGLMC